MSNTSTFVFVHDQQIILDADASGKFKDLPSLTYVLLGERPIDRISERSDVIVARNMENNIEQYSGFCSFTGWYVIWKNNLIKTEYVHLLEYDIEIKRRFNQTTQELMDNKYNFIGYAPLPLAENFINSHVYSKKLIEVMKKHYNIDGRKVVKQMKKVNRKFRWSSTSNSTFDINSFNEYMTWFEKFIDDLKGDRLAGHAHERSISVFWFLFNKKVFMTDEILKHAMANSHKLTC